MAKLAAAVVRSVFRPLVQQSRLRVGAIDARGTASILLGVAAIVLAAGATAALGKATTALPEGLREARLLWLAIRSPRVEIATAAPAP
jgi:hypothetical protein